MSQDSLIKLRCVTAAEKATIIKCAERCKQLTAKIREYQVGRGPAPTPEEFSEWVKNVEQHVALKKALI